MCSEDVYKRQHIQCCISVAKLLAILVCICYNESILVYLRKQIILRYREPLCSIKLYLTVTRFSTNSLHNANYLRLVYQRQKLYLNSSCLGSLQRYVIRRNTNSFYFSKRTPWSCNACSIIRIGRCV